MAGFPTYKLTNQTTTELACRGRTMLTVIAKGRCGVFVLLSCVCVVCAYYMVLYERRHRKIHCSKNDRPFKTIEFRIGSVCLSGVSFFAICFFPFSLTLRFFTVNRASSFAFFASPSSKSAGATTARSERALKFTASNSSNN